MSTNTRIIGLSGTNGAGKDTVGRILSEHHNFLFISVTDLLRDEAKRRGLPVEREHLRTISAEWRREHGLGVLVDRAVADFESKKDQYDGVVMASLRNPYETDRVHELGGVVIWVDADPKVRYERVQANAADRGRAAEDTKTFEEFLAEEQAEMQFSGDEATLNMSAVKERCDICILNNTTEMEVLATEIEKALDLNK